MYGYSAKEGKMYGGDERGEGEGRMEAGVHHLSWMSGRFFFSSQGQGANLFISLEVTMKFYRVLCSDDEISSYKFVLPFGCQ